MQTHPHQSHSDTTPESDRRPGSENLPQFTPSQLNSSQLSSSQLSSSQLNSSHESQPSESNSESKKRTAINVPARALLTALKVHYQVCSASLAKQGIADSTINENTYIGSILSQNMNSIFDLLSGCEPCAEHVQQVLIDDIDIEDIPHEFILESVRRRAVDILLYG